MTLNLALRPIAIGIDAAVCQELVEELLCQLGVKSLRDIAQGITDGELSILAIEMESPFRCATNTWFKQGSGGRVELRRGLCGINAP